MTDQELPDELVRGLTDCTNKVEKEMEAMEAKGDDVAKAFRKELAVLFKERQPVLDKIEDFWANAFTCENSPVKQFFNTTTDPRIARAITSLFVEYGENDAGQTRKVTLVLRASPFIEAGTLSRHSVREGKVLSFVAPKWKPGTERQRGSSFFALFFGPEPEDRDAADDMLDAIDLLFSNPFLHMKKDE